MAPDGEFFQIIVGTIINIEINVAFDARQSACIGVLPEFPFAFIFDLIHIIMSNPIGIIIEHGGAEIELFEFEIGVDDGLHVVFVFDDVQPREHVALKIFNAFVLWFVLNVEHGGQVSFFEVDLF